MQTPGDVVSKFYNSVNDEEFKEYLTKIVTEHMEYLGGTYRSPVEPSFSIEYTPNCDDGIDIFIRCYK